MADRYQTRPFPSDDRGRGGDQRRSGQAESDPLAELARLIGQSDSLAAPGRASARPPAATWESPDHYEPQAEGIAPESYSESYQDPTPGWIRRANVQPQPAPLPPQEYPAEEAWHGQGVEQGHESVEAGLGYHQQSDFSRYDDALYDHIETGEQNFQSDREYPDDPYAYQDDYPEEEVHQDKPENRRRGGMKLVAAILAFAFVGTGSAITYKKYLGPRHHVDPPTITADNTPTKIVPTPPDGAAKIPDQSGDGAERIVPREEEPIDVSSTSANPRVVLPTSSQSANPTVTPPSDARRVRTVVIQGPADGTAPQGAVPQGTTPQGATPQGATPVRSVAPRNPATANASANQPLSLAPQAASGRQQVAAATPTTQIAPTTAPESGYLVSISSQDSEAAAKESFRVAQGKYSSVLGSHSVVIKRAEVNGKVYYRAMVGPYRTRQEAAQFCTELKAAGGQCFIP